MVRYKNRGRKPIVALKLPEIDPRYYTYIGTACAMAGFMFIALAILSILGILRLGIEFLWVAFTGLGILFMLFATASFHKIGGKKIPV